MKQNCLTFALAHFRFLRRGDYFSFRRSHWGPFPHFSVIKELENGNLIKQEFVPVEPRRRWLPPLFFRGQVITTVYIRTDQSTINPEDTMTPTRTNKPRSKLHAFLIGAALGIALAVIATGALAGALTDYAENKLVDAVLRGQTLGAPATMHIGLGTDTCTDAGAGTEPTGNAYARVAVTSSLANWAGTQAAASTTASTGTGGTTSNNAAITWTASTGAWGNLQSVRWYDAASAGNSWICINLTTPLNVSGAGFTVQFPAASLQFQIDN